MQGACGMVLGNARRITAPLGMRDSISLNKNNCTKKNATDRQKFTLARRILTIFFYCAPARPISFLVLVPVQRISGFQGFEKF